LSLGFASERMLAALEGAVVERDGYAALTWPALPTAFEANMLVFDRPPEPGDVVRWEALFRRAMVFLPEVRHVAFGWEGGPVTAEVAAALERQGYALSALAVRVADRALAGTAAPVGVAVRPLEGRAEWAAAADLHLALDSPAAEVDGYAEFVEARMARCAALCAAGAGQWLGAFAGARLVGSLGVMTDRAHSGLGRVQLVVTHAAFRRRGVASHLLTAADARARDHLGVQRLVICAEPGSPADRLYARLGFAEAPPMHRAIRPGG
jgi:GNAT superfamily N-acetyltransferase